MSVLNELTPGALLPVVMERPTVVLKELIPGPVLGF